MIKKIILILLALYISQNIVYARSVPPKPGSIKTFSSANKIYTIDIKILGYPGNSLSECTFKKNNEILWEKSLSTTPGFVDISDNGACFVFANWGWYDEGAFSSFSFYNGAGELLKTVELGAGRNGLRWLEKTFFSNDGNYYLAANGFKDVTEITLYHTPTQTELWDRYTGLGNIDNILINKTGEYILMSTFDYNNHNIHFSYMDRYGNILWEKEIPHGHLWDNKFIWLSDNGLQFKVYYASEKKWILFENHDGNILREEN